MTDPAFLADAGFKRTDESYESLVYEANVTTTFVKLSTFGFGKTLYRLAFTFRAAQDGAEMAAPHDGSGIVGYAGVAAGGIFMRDLLPVEQVLVLYEPFAAAFPYESLQ